MNLENRKRLWNGNNYIYALLKEQNLRAILLREKTVNKKQVLRKIQSKGWNIDVDNIDFRRQDAEPWHVNSIHLKFQVNTSRPTKLNHF